MLLADAILVLHVLFTGTVVLAVPLIIIGGVRGWAWVRSPWFRCIHLFMIGFVATEALIGMDCPLTVWENTLRTAAGQAGYGATDFIASWLGKILYYQFPHWVFTASYVGFGLLVLGLFYFVPVSSRSDFRKP